jgi:glycosyltransferase involved in cell wall biosynthesis
MTAVKPYRILHAIRSVKAAGGGPIEAVKQTMAAHRQHGHQSEVLTLDSPTDPAVKELPVCCHGLGPSLTGYSYTSRLVPWLRANRERFDAVVVHGIWQYHAFGVWRTLAGTSTPYFVFPHGMLDPWFKRTYPLKHAKKWLYWPWADYRVLRDARGVLFTCEEERSLARESFWLYRCREFVVGLGTAEPTGDPAVQQQTFLNRFPQLKGKRCLLFLGRVHIKKGPELLLRAFADVMARRPDAEREVRLVMAGPNDHAYGQEMFQLAEALGLSDRIVWTGMLTGDAKWGAFRAADAFVLPSHQENFGIAVVEALACGVPVLISNQVNIWRTIQDAAAGLVGSDDIAGTVQMLETWLGAPLAEWDLMRVRARACFEQSFRIDRTAENLIRLFDANLQPNRPCETRVGA